MLTRAGAMVAAGAVVAVAAGRALGANELYFLGAVAALLPLLALVWVRRPSPKVTVRRRVDPPRVTVGDHASVVVTIHNAGTRATPTLTLVDPVAGTAGARVDLGPVAPGAVLRTTYWLTTTRRGVLQVGPLTAELTDPFGLARRTLPCAEVVSATVLPRIEHVDTLPRGGGRHEPVAGQTSRYLAASGAADLATLRPYVVGDDLRRVHWPSSAHHDDLQVRRDETRWQGQVTVLLDARAHTTTPKGFEEAVSGAAGILHAAGEAGDQARLVVTDGVDSGMVDAVRSAGVLLEALAVVERHETPARGLSPGPVRHPSALVVLLGTGTLDELVPPAHVSTFDHTVVVHLLDTPFVTAWAEAMAATRLEAVSR